MGIAKLRLIGGLTQGFSRVAGNKSTIAISALSEPPGKALIVHTNARHQEHICFASTCCDSCLGCRGMGILIHSQLAAR